MPLLLTTKKDTENFILKNKDRIICTAQVATEFNRHKKKLKAGVLKTIKLQQTHPNIQKVIHKINVYYEENKDLLEAYPNFNIGLKNNLLESKHIETLYKKKVLPKTNQLKALYIQKDWFKLIDELPKLPAFSKKIIQELKNQFDTMAKFILQKLPNQSDSAFKYFFSKQPQLKFPGYADLLKKHKNPYGDYIIFYEILNWIDCKKPSVPPIFITNDIAKGDWLDGKKRPYWHYFENMYIQTKQIFYVKHAAETFEKIENLSFEYLSNPQQLIKDLSNVLFEQRNQQDAEKITPNTLLQFLNKTYPYRKATKLDLEQIESIIEALNHVFGIKSIRNLEDDLIDNYPVLIDYELKNFCYLNQIEAMEQTLDLIFE